MDNVTQCDTVSADMPTKPVNVRVDSSVLVKLEKIGAELKPKPLNRSEMINVAIREYVERHGTRKLRSSD